MIKSAASDRPHSGRRQPVRVPGLQDLALPCTVLCTSKRAQRDGDEDGAAVFVIQGGQILPLSPHDVQVDGERLMVRCAYCRDFMRVAISRLNEVLRSEPQPTAISLPSYKVPRRHLPDDLFDDVFGEPQ